MCPQNNGATVCRQNFADVRLAFAFLKNELY